MAGDILPDTDAKAETGNPVDELVQLTVNVGFYARPIFFNSDDSPGKEPVKEGPPFIRFPVQLSPKDARIIEQLLDNPVAFVAFEIQNTNGQPGYYRLVSAGN